MLTFTFLLVGCATLPPPRIENGKYINPKFEFAIDIPEGWKQVDKPPLWFKSALSQAQKAKLCIMFFNNKTNGMIAIYRDKTMVPYQMFYGFSGKMCEKYRKYLEREKKKCLKDPYVKRYSYKVDRFDQWSVEIDYENEIQKLKAISNGFMYKCQKDDTCSVIVELVSDVKTFDENESVYLKMIDSLQEGYVEVVDK